MLESIMRGGFASFIYILIILGVIIWVVNSIYRQKKIAQIRYHERLKKQAEQDRKDVISDAEDARPIEYVTEDTGMSVSNFYLSKFIEQLALVTSASVRRLSPVAGAESLEDLRVEFSRMQALLHLQFENVVGPPLEEEIQSSYRRVEEALAEAKAKGMVRGEREFGSLPHTQPPREYRTVTSERLGIRVHSTMSDIEVAEALRFAAPLVISPTSDADKLEQLRNILQRGQVNEVKVELISTPEPQVYRHRWDTLNVTTTLPRDEVATVVKPYLGMPITESVMEEISFILKQKTSDEVIVDTDAT
ncbi:hypothetical protein Peetri_00073 [Pseudomonas phage vB_PpuM-Peetri]